MELSSEFCNRLKDLGYPKELRTEDILQIAQGHAKPLLEFIVKTTRPPSEVRRVRTCSLITRQSPEVSGPVLPSPVTTEEASKNSERILELRQAIRAKKNRMHIFNAYAHRIKTVIEKLKIFKDTLGLSSSSNAAEIDSSALEAAADRLVYLHKPNEQLKVPVIKGIFDSLEIESHPRGVFEKVKNSLNEELRNISQIIATFNPDQEAQSIGIDTEAHQVNVQQLLSELHAQIKVKRNEESNKFDKIQQTFEKTKALHDKFKEVYGNKQPSNLTPYHSAALEVNSYKAQLACLKQSMKGLSHLHEDLKSKLAILEQKKLATNQDQEDSNSMSLKVSDTANANTMLRRHLAHYKVRINDFVQKYVMSFRGEISPLIDPLQSIVIKEGQEFLALSDYLMEETVPMPFGTNLPETTTEEQPPHPLTNKIIKKVYKFMNVGPHLSRKLTLSVARQYATCAKSCSIPFARLPKVTDIEQKDYRKDVDRSDRKIKEEIERVRSVSEKLVPLWREQPAQHCVPWLKLHAEMNLTEALLYWKSIIKE